jgi:hypothetical protein
VLKTGTGLTIGSAGVGDCSERSRTSFCVAEVGVVADVVAAGVGVGVAAGVGVGVAAEVGVAAGAGVTTAAGVTTGAALAAFGVGGTPPRGAPEIGALVAAEELFVGLYVLKNSIHDGSTEVGSAW